MSIPERLVSVRKKHGYTRTRLSDEMKIPYGTIAKYESGEREPGHSYIVQMANKFGVSTDYLLGLEDDSPAEAEKNPPTPAEPEQEEAVTMRAVEDFLVALGYIQPGGDLTDSDFRIINAILDILDAWFQEER